MTTETPTTEIQQSQPPVPEVAPPKVLIQTSVQNIAEGHRIIFPAFDVVVVENDEVTNTGLFIIRLDPQCWSFGYNKQGGLFSTNHKQFCEVREQLFDVYWKTQKAAELGILEVVHLVLFGTKYVPVAADSPAKVKVEVEDEPIVEETPDPLFAAMARVNSSDE